jgi:hypothetical protein
MGVVQMTAEDETIPCPITKRMEQIDFRRKSDKGYVQCCVTVLIGTCNNCQQKSTDPEAHDVFDEAFKREYDKLP